MTRQLRLGAAFLLNCIPLFGQFQFNVGNYPTSGSPTSIAVADFDRDGYPDIAIANVQSQTSSTVDIYRNNGDGTFQPYKSYAIASAGGIVAADFNGDGWPDIAVAGLNANKNSLLINDGTGAFRLGPAPLTQRTTNHFVAGDFNGDGKVDLAAVETVFGQPSQIEILKNTGAATFTRTQVLTLPTSTINAVAYDFDGDGKLDIADALPSKTQIWWGKGDGTFASPLELPSPSVDALYSLINADFDSDAREDFAVTTIHPCSDPTNFCGTNTVWVYRNLGKRQFKVVSSSTLGTDAGGYLYTADLNGDLKPDLAMLNDSVWVGAITYRLGNGNGTFGPAQNLTGTTAPEIAFRDLNHDTRTDVAIASNFPGGELDVLLSTTGNVACSTPGTKALAAHVCAPAAGSTVSNPVVFRASGDSPVGVKRLELWIDGVKRYQKHGNQMAVSISLARGTHSVTVVAVDQYAGYRKNSRTITVR